MNRSLAELGREALFDIRERNAFGGPVDIILDGVPLEIKTPTKPNAATAFNRIAKSKKDGIYQSDDYILNLMNVLPEDHYERLIVKLVGWKRRHPGKSVYILRHWDGVLRRLNNA